MSRTRSLLRRNIFVRILQTIWSPGAEKRMINAMVGTDLLINTQHVDDGELQQENVYSKSKKHITKIPQREHHALLKKASKTEMSTSALQMKRTAWNDYKNTFRFQVKGTCTENVKSTKIDIDTPRPAMTFMAIQYTGIELMDLHQCTKKLNDAISNITRPEAS